MIVESEIHGEKDTGFEKYDHRGPFECGNCRYFKGNACHQRVMVAKSKQPRSGDGVKVDSKDCCEYVDRIGSRGSLTKAARK